jgi:hypothetical protein
MQLTITQKIDAINILADADGEDLQYILEKIGMDYQILSQLVATAKKFDLMNVLEERDIIKDACKKVWMDIFNNDTLIYNDFESYWENFNKKLN